MQSEANNVESSNYLLFLHACPEEAIFILIICNHWPYERFHQFHQVFLNFYIFPVCIQFHDSVFDSAFSCVDVF